MSCQLRKLNEYKTPPARSLLQRQKRPRNLPLRPRNPTTKPTTCLLRSGCKLWPTFASSPETIRLERTQWARLEEREADRLGSSLGGWTFAWTSTTTLHSERTEGFAGESSRLLRRIERLTCAMGKRRRLRRRIKRRRGRGKRLQASEFEPLVVLRCAIVIARCGRQT